MGTSTITPAGRSPAARGPLLGWIFSSIGKKFIVALSGIALVLFVIGHLLGNLTFFLGPDAINLYAVKLHNLGPILWIIRLGLLAIVGVHIVFTMLLWKENQTARPGKYAVKNKVQSSVFSRTMRLSGLFVLVFIVFHIAHFTAQVVDPAYQQLYATLDGEQVRDVFTMMVMGFSNPVVSGFYVLALGLLAFHLSHGIGSLFQTLGLSNSKLRPIYETTGRVVAWLLFAGFSSIPISVVVFGYGKEALK